MLRFLTAGESHGRALVVIVEGLPAGLPVTAPEIAGELARRRLGLRARAPDALRGRRDHPARRHPPRAHPGLPGRHRDRQHRMAQVGGGDVARPRVALQGPHQAPPGPRRSGRDAEVRLRRRPRRARAGVGPRDRGPGGGRVPGQGPAGAARDLRAEPRRGPRAGARRRRWRARGRPTSSGSTTRRSGASTPRSRRGWWRPSRRPPRTGTRSAAWWRSSPTAFRWASAATCTGTAGSTACWPRRS